jgi:hypothetical protein
MPPLELYPLDDRGSFAWMLGPADPMSRASSAIVLGAGTVLVDPVEADGLDAELSSLPAVIGVVTLLDRHQRDAAAIAERLGVPRLTPTALGGDGLALGGVQERTVTTRRGWHEALMWLPDRRLLVCTETLGTAGFDLARRGDPLGMHPFARPFPPRAAFRDIDPAVIAVGHGSPLTVDAGAAMRRVLGRARLQLPRHWVRFGLEAVTASLAARQARR